MKVLFLDIDGVLVTKRTLALPLLCSVEVGPQQSSGASEAHVMHFNEFEPEAVTQLNRIAQVTHADFVISSSWRHGSPEMFDAVKVHFRNQGVIGEVIGRTPDLGKRGDEIKAWLSDRPRAAPRVVYAVLDDDVDDMHGVLVRTVQTSMETGLTKAHADQVIALLS